MKKYIYIGKKIEILRKERLLSIRKLSKLTKINEKYLSKIEKGKAKRINLIHIFTIAEALKIDPLDLI